MKRLSGFRQAVFIKVGEDGKLGKVERLKREDSIFWTGKYRHDCLVKDEMYDFHFEYDYDSNMCMVTDVEGNFVLYSNDRLSKKRIVEVYESLGFEDVSGEDVDFLLGNSF